MNIFTGVMVHAHLPVEGHENEPEHIKSSHESGDGSDGPDGKIAGEKRIGENLILAPESSQRRDPRNRDRTYHKGPVGNGHLRAKPAHIAHVLLLVHGGVMKGVNDASTSEEEKSLEKSMGHEVEDAGRESAHAEGNEHKAELAHRAYRPKRA